MKFEIPVFAAVLVVLVALFLGVFGTEIHHQITAPSSNPVVGLSNPSSSPSPVASASTSDSESLVEPDTVGQDQAELTIVHTTNLVHVKNGLYKVETSYCVSNPKYTAQYDPVLSSRLAETQKQQQSSTHNLKSGLRGWCDSTLELAMNEFTRDYADWISQQHVLQP